MSRQRETPRGAPRTVPSSSGKRNTVLIATLTERGFFSFVEATSRFLGSCEKLWLVSLPLGIRLPVTRSVGLKGQGGPGVSETRGGARGVIDRRHEAPPRVTGKPSATLRLRHPVPALPPLALLAPAARASAERILVSRVRRTVCFGCSNRQPTVCSKRAPHVVLRPWSLSSVGLVDLSDPTTALQLRTGVTGGSYSVSISSAVIGVRLAVGFVASRSSPNVWRVRSASTDWQAAFGPKSPRPRWPYLVAGRLSAEMGPTWPQSPYK